MKRSRPTRAKSSPADGGKGRLPAPSGRQARSLALKWDEVFQAIGHPTVILDPTGLVLAANRATLERTGKSREELVGKHCHEVFHGSEGRPPACPLRHLLESGEFSMAEMEVEALGGVFQVSCTPVLDDNGRLRSIIHIATEVTARFEAMEALRVSEEKLKSIIEHGSELLYIHDPQHRFRYVSPQSARVLGYPPEEMMIEWTRLVTDNPINRKGCESCERALQTGERQEPYLLEVRRRDGRRVVLEINESPFRDAAGRVAGIIGAARDVTRRTRAEAALRRSEEQYRRIVETAQEGILVLDPRGRVGYANRRLVEILGSPDDDLTGRELLDFVVEPMRDEVRGRFSASRGGSREHFETQLRRRDGQTVWVSVSAAPITGADGRFLGSLAMVSDVTERRRAQDQLLWESALNLSLARLAGSLVAGAFDLMEIASQVRKCAEELTGSRSGYVAEIGAATGSLRVLSGSREAGTACGVPGLAPGDVLAKGPDGRYPGLWGQALNTGEAFFTNETASHPAATGLPAGTHLPAQFLSVPVRYEGRLVGQIVLVDCGRGYGERDLTVASRIGDLFGLAIHRQRAEAERQAFQTRLQETQRLESLGVMAGGIAHDFNNLLMGVLGYADLALMTASLESPVREYLKLIVTAAQRASELTNQMLAYSGKAPSHIEPIDLNHLMGEMGSLLGTLIDKKARLRFLLTPSLPPVEADAGQLRQVVVNLVANASDALEGRGGQILVRSGELDADREFLDTAPLAEDLPTGRYAVIEVADTGQGMDPATRARIFEPFFTTKFTGRGLGLAAVLGILRGHRGTIHVESEPGRGSRFKVLLPVAAAPASRADRGREAGPEAGGQVTVLVVDDEATVLEVASQMLAFFGYRVLTASGGREALEVFQRNPEGIDLVLLDMTMPGMNGEATFLEMLRVRPGVRVILSSGYSEEDAAASFVGRGLAGFVQKPYRASTLVEKVRRTLAGREDG